ncbi:hypothetical protein Nmel_017513, partial [Mimus melanotis]
MGSLQRILLSNPRLWENSAVSLECLFFVCRHLSPACPLRAERALTEAL